MRTEFEDKRRRITDQSTSNFVVGELSLVAEQQSEEDKETHELTNGLLYYSQRLQMWLNKGIICISHQSQITTVSGLRSGV